jgi:hypothetical protein
LAAQRLCRYRPAHSSVVLSYRDKKTGVCVGFLAAGFIEEFIWGIIFLRCVSVNRYRTKKIELHVEIHPALQFGS